MEITSAGREVVTTVALVGRVGSKKSALFAAPYCGVLIVERK